MPGIVCVVPSVRPESMMAFRKAWRPLFEKHRVTLVTVWDGNDPEVHWADYTPFKQPPDEEPQREFKSSGGSSHVLNYGIYKEHRDLFCRHTDAVRNVGFVHAAKLGAEYVLTLDDDVLPFDPWTSPDVDPIQDHLDAINKSVPVSWINTAMDAYYLRGVPYDVRKESPVMLSHGVWTGTPDFDGETQLRIEEKHKRVPYRLPYYVGPVPRGVHFPLCGMNVMVRREALPHLYFAPMGPDSGFPALYRFADIWLGIHLKRVFDKAGWSCYTGASVIHHSRASDARKNFEQEKLGREWNEVLWKLESGVPHEDTLPAGLLDYLKSWHLKRERYADWVNSLL